MGINTVYAIPLSKDEMTAQCVQTIDNSAGDVEIKLGDCLEASIDNNNRVTVTLGFLDSSFGGFVDRKAFEVAANTDGTKVMPMYTIVTDMIVGIFLFGQMI